MSVGNTEVLYGDRWIYESLSAAGLRAYPDIAPSGDEPVITYSYSGGSDLNALGAHRYLVRAVYNIKAVGAGGSYAPLKDTADAIDAALASAINAVVADGVIVVSCLRQGTIRYSEAIEGVVYRHLGGTYVILIAPAP